MQQIKKLIDKWTTSIEIIDHVNISYYLTYHIFENFLTYYIYFVLEGFITNNFLLSFITTIRFT